MFGTYRLLLALLVLLKHFKETEVFSGMAVWAFFLLSGFLITGAINRSYRFDRADLLEFSLNRALRIFPTYWLSILLAFMSIWVFGDVIDPRSINSALGIPGSFQEWISTVFIFGGTFFGIGRLETSLSPSSWAVDVEMVMYAASILWLSRTRKGAKLTFLICTGAFPFLYLISKLLMQNGYAELAGSLIYSFLPAALIPYSMGACLWHHREMLPKHRKPNVHLVLSGIFFVICGAIVSRWSVTASFIASLPILAYITWLLSNIKADNRRLDTFLGHMSYPTYLLHWVGNHAALAIGHLWGKGTELVVPNEQGLMQTTVMGFGLIVLVTLLISAVVAWCFESPIDARRHQWSSKLTELSFGQRGSRRPEKNV